MSTSRTFVAGAVLTAAQQNDLAQGQIGYTQVVADQTGMTSVDLTGLTVTVTVVAGRRIKITGCADLENNTNTTTLRLDIKEGATVLKSCQMVAGAANVSETRMAIVVLTPSVGAHTYKLAYVQSGGTGAMRASATNPAFILVEDIGV